MAGMTTTIARNTVQEVENMPVDIKSGGLRAAVSNNN
jgi:hypothetical protein